MKQFAVFALCSLPLVGAILFGARFWPVWRMAVRTGRWLAANDRAYYFPSKHYTFTIYDRAEAPTAFWFGVIIIPVLVSLFFVSSLALAVAAFFRL